MNVTAVGGQTELGRIGRSIEEIATEKTPLQRQINLFVIRMAWIGVGAFVLVWGVNYARSGNWITALLFGLTLAMAILPEEIPVAFSSFMALGAARLSRMGVLTKQPQTVESGHRHLPRQDWNAHAGRDDPRADLRRRVGQSCPMARPSDRLAGICADVRLPGQ